MSKTGFEQIMAAENENEYMAAMFLNPQNYTDEEVEQIKQKEKELGIELKNGESHK